MPADPGFKQLRATDVDELVNLVAKYARDGESLIETVKRLEAKVKRYEEALRMIAENGHSHGWDECCADGYFEIAQDALSDDAEKGK
jgi:uncharacterized protein (UPF0335 family)